MAISVFLFHVHFFNLLLFRFEMHVGFQYGLGFFSCAAIPLTCNSVSFLLLEQKINAFAYHSVKNMLIKVKLKLETHLRFYKQYFFFLTEKKCHVQAIYFSYRQRRCSVFTFVLRSSFIFIKRFAKRQYCHQ